MKTLYYEAITVKGDKIRGTFIGSVGELIEHLRSKNAVLVNLKEQKKRFKKGRYSSSDLMRDFESLGYLVSSGMKIDKAVSMLCRTAKKSSSAGFWNNVLINLKEGKQFSIAIREAAKSNRTDFSELYVNILSVGEEIGDIEGAILKVFNHMQFKRNLIKEVKSALAYPAFLLFMSLVVIMFTVTLIIPKFSSIFTDKELEKLPAISKSVITAGSFLNKNLDFVLIVSVAVLSVIVLILANRRINYRIKQVLYSFPVLNRLLLFLDLSNLFSSLGAMLRGGVDIVKAVRMSKRVVGFDGLKNMLTEVESELKKGHKISQVLERYSIIPEDAVSLIAAGENSANLDAVCSRLGERYLNDFKTAVSKFVVLLEPTIIVFLGVFIGFIVVSIMLAVVSLTNVAG